MSFKEYASKEYIYDNFLKQQWEAADSGKVAVVNSRGKMEPQAIIFDHITMVDRISGYKCFLYIEGNKIVTTVECIKIEVIAMPAKVSYIKGQPFNPTDMVVVATYADGSTSEITAYTYDKFVLTNEITISYTNLDGTTVATTINLEVTAFNPEIVLIDFRYTDNNDGTYTIIDWNGTLNGEPSTEMIVPDNCLIIM